MIQISEAEWQVMEVLWEHPGRNGREVALALKNTGWTEATVKTLLNRLLKKKALRHEQTDRHYTYFPAVQRTECQQREAVNFLRRVFGGSSPVPLVAHFLENQKLTEAELAELRQLLDRHDDAR